MSIDGITRPVVVPTLPSDQDASGRTFDDTELDLVREVLSSGTLTVTKGPFGARLEQGFAALLGTRHASACASGSGAVHLAVAAVDPEPGDEIVTTSITDMGALTPILYQGAIPVFADVDARTGNVTAATVADALSDRTRAVVVTHLFGNPCDTAAIVDLATARGIPVIEDCAQAYLATEHGRPVGTIGAIGAFSLQQGKHITCGEGGLVVTDDEHLARRVRLGVNKAWPYGEPDPDHEFAALNNRMSELQAAVALGQLGKLTGIVEARRAMAARLTEALDGVPGLTLPAAAPHARHSWWKYPVLVDPEVIPGGPTALAARLKAFSVASAPRYIQKPAFRCAVFRDQRTFGASRWPFALARPEAVDYDPARFPGTFTFLDRVLVLPFNERYTAAHVDGLALALRDAVASLVDGSAS